MRQSLKYLLLLPALTAFAITVQAQATVQRAAATLESRATPTQAPTVRPADQKPVPQTAAQILPPQVGRQAAPKAAPGPDAARPIQKSAAILPKGPKSPAASPHR